MKQCGETHMEIDGSQKVCDWSVASEFLWLSTEAEELQLKQRHFQPRLANREVNMVYSP